jgi:peptidoglycan hydrolase-like protein with peptidoglycan-binding domain
VRTLRTNQRGPDVEQWQQFLRSQGLLSDAVDDIFGVQTDAATRAFQKRECLDVDGLVGPDTLGRAEALGFVAFRRTRDAEVTPALAAEAKRLLAPRPMAVSIPSRSTGAATSPASSSTTTSPVAP